MSLTLRLPVLLLFLQLINDLSICNISFIAPSNNVSG